MAAAEEKTETFEDRLQRLSRLVEELEGGELSLEDAIQRFESGKVLHRELLDQLAAYERRLEKLVEAPDGSDRVVDASAGLEFDSEDEGD
jgi:exodeoxyribonuclease VII small subunit